MRSRATPCAALVSHISLLLGCLWLFSASYVLAYRQEAFIGYSEKYGKAETEAKQKQDVFYISVDLAKFLLQIFAGDQIVIKTSHGEVKDSI